MEPRLKYYQAAPEGYRALRALEDYVDASSLEESLLNLLKLRASQINGCAFCIDMHWKDARAAGESDERLYMLDAWREHAAYSDRERAALAWTESLGSRRRAPRTTSGRQSGRSSATGSWRTSRWRSRRSTSGTA